MSEGEKAILNSAMGRRKSKKSTNECTKAKKYIFCKNKSVIMPTTRQKCECVHKNTDRRVKVLSEQMKGGDCAL